MGGQAGRRQGPVKQHSLVQTNPVVGRRGEQREQVGRKGRFLGLITP